MCATLFAAPGVTAACDDSDENSPTSIGELPAPASPDDLPDQLLCDRDSDDEDDDSSDDDLLPATRGLLDLAQPIARHRSSYSHQQSPSLQPSSIFRPPRV